MQRRLASPTGSQPNYIARELFQFMVDPSGKVVLYGDSEVATCVG
jgi:hypothetical protein